MVDRHVGGLSGQHGLLLSAQVGRSSMPGHKAVHCGCWRVFGHNKALFLATTSIMRVLKTIPSAATCLPPGLVRLAGGAPQDPNLPHPHHQATAQTAHLTTCGAGLCCTVATGPAHHHRATGAGHHTDPCSSASDSVATAAATAAAVAEGAAGATAAAAAPAEAGTAAGAVSVAATGATAGAGSGALPLHTVMKQLKVVAGRQQQLLVVAARRCLLSWLVWLRSPVWHRCSRRR